LIRYDKPTSSKDAVDQRLSISVNLNKFSNFVTFDVALNQIPILISHGERTKEEFD